MYEEQRHGYAVKTTSYATRNRSKHSHRWMNPISYNNTSSQLGLFQAKYTNTTQPETHVTLMP